MKQVDEDAVSKTPVDRDHGPEAQMSDEGFKDHSAWNDDVRSPRIEPLASSLRAHLRQLFDGAGQLSRIDMAGALRRCELDHGMGAARTAQGGSRGPRNPSR